MALHNTALDSNTEKYSIENYLDTSKHKNEQDKIFVSDPLRLRSRRMTHAKLEWVECKICTVLNKSGNLPCILNKGLYCKYVESQDFFYHKKIDVVIAKRRHPTYIRHEDDLIFDESKEYMKSIFNKKEAKSLMREITTFYSQFHNFPRIFQKPFFSIINTNIVKHRRLEYIKVFQSNNPNEQNHVQSQASKEQSFNFMNMLGETFLRENYKDISSFVMAKVSDKLITSRRDTELFIKEAETNFNILKVNSKDKKKPPESHKNFEDLKGKYMLYTPNDSETAEEMLKNIFEEIQKSSLRQKDNFKDKTENPEKSATKICKEEEKISLSAKKETLIINRTQSPKTNLKSKKLKPEYDFSKEMVKGIYNEKDNLYLKTERGKQKGLKNALDYQKEEKDPKLMKNEVLGNLFKKNSKNLKMNTNEKEPVPMVSVKKNNSENFKRGLLSPLSILNFVSKLNSTQKKQQTSKIEKNRPHTIMQNKPSTAYNVGLSTVTSAQSKVSLYSPTTSKAHALMEPVVFKKPGERFSRTPRVRHEIPASNTIFREHSLKKGDPLEFGSLKSTRHKGPCLSLDSPGFKKVFRSTKSPSSANRQIDKEKTISMTGKTSEEKTIDLKKVVDNLYPKNYKHKKRRPIERGLPKSADRALYSSNETRSSSYKARKPQIEISPSGKKRSNRRKEISPQSGHYQSVSNLSQRLGPLTDTQHLINFKELDHTNDEWLKLADLYLQILNMEKKKSRSIENTIVYQNKNPRMESTTNRANRKKMNLELEHNSEKQSKRSSFFTNRGNIEFFSPKFSDAVSFRDKTPLKPEIKKGYKHIRHASRA